MLSFKTTSHLVLEKNTVLVLEKNIFTSFTIYRHGGHVGHMIRTAGLQVPWGPQIKFGYN